MTSIHYAPPKTYLCNLNNFLNKQVYNAKSNIKFRYYNIFFSHDQNLVPNMYLLTRSLGKGNEARAAQNAVHEVNKRALSRARKTHQENRNNRRNIGLVLVNTSGWHPKITGPIREQLLPELVEPFAGNKSQSLKLPQHPEPRREARHVGGIELELSALLEPLRRPPPAVWPRQPRQVVLVFVARSRAQLVLHFFFFWWGEIGL
ncbi:LOW QUALITY PROTEIN: hypothetical protein TorRG33x02_252320 [Trema orientale]|uniref:Uncharacterized protein n=1 Tax=Trema orientale TaxID=63057 RepID=A0A2P5DGJ9_TREOI|nr:LOW QUALITY PROTEIN: hypothetical protein TorRG33x02_252320 [Trema orientale]